TTGSSGDGTHRLPPASGRGSGTRERVRGRIRAGAGRGEDRARRARPELAGSGRRSETALCRGTPGTRSAARGTTEERGFFPGPCRRRELHSVVRHGQQLVVPLATATCAARTVP